MTSSLRLQLYNHSDPGNEWSHCFELLHAAMEFGGQTSVIHAILVSMKGSQELVTDTSRVTILSWPLAFLSFQLSLNLLSCLPALDMYMNSHLHLLSKAVKKRLLKYMNDSKPQSCQPSYLMEDYFSGSWLSEGDEPLAYCTHKRTSTLHCPDSICMY